MNKKSKIFIQFAFILILLGGVELLYISISKIPNLHAKEQKKRFVSLIALPDLALSSEASFVRHRSLSTVFDIYRDGEGLTSYFPTASLYWHATLLHHTPSKVLQ